MVSAEDVVHVYQLLSSNHIQVWLIGGWGIDALLQEQTRPHKDLDIIVLVDDVAWMREFLGRERYTLAYLWSENIMVLDTVGAETPTGFVLRDPEGREVDVHAMRMDDRGVGVPAWAVKEGLVFTGEDLAGRGSIAGIEVRCITAERQVVCHRGYDLPESHLNDMERLKRKFGV
jgi:lincosamide nucleotidyltransferase A/C/D/E